MALQCTNAINQYRCQLEKGHTGICEDHRSASEIATSVGAEPAARVDEGKYAAARVEHPTPFDVRETFKHLLSRTTGKAWEYYETVSGKYIVREDDGDDAGPLAHFESADDAAFVCSAKNAIAELLMTAPAAPVVEQREHEGRLIMQKDWVALLTEICKVYGILEPEWDDADIHAIAEEFDPWNALREIDKKLRAPAAGSAERWIPVSEKMPILYSSALIVHTETRDGKAIVEEAQYVGSDEYGQWCLVRTLRDDESIYLTEQVTHWRPLPSPPALAGTDTDVAKGE